MGYVPAYMKGIYMANKDLQLMASKLNHAREMILKGFKEACLGYLEAGKWLMIVRQQQLWKLDGTHVKRFDQWITSELNIGRSSAYNAMNVYEKYGPLITGNPDYQTIDFSHIVALLPYANDKTTVGEKERLLNLALGNTVKGLRDNLRELSGKAPSDSECEHLETKVMTVCLKCGKWMEQ